MGSFIERVKKIRGTEVYRRLNTIPLYITSAYRSWHNSRPFDDVKTLCVFIGHGRSGHSIIGALLDAHPHAIVADEVDTLRYLNAGFSQNQLYHLMWSRSRKEARKERKKSGRDGKVLSYQVPNQWQGKFQKLEVIGDSKAGASIVRLTKNPRLLRRLYKGVKADIKFIHIVRNPFDNISTMSIRRERSQAVSTRIYFRLCYEIANLRSTLPAADILCLRHEDLIANPQAFLTKLCTFVGLEPIPDYLEACASIIYKNPAQSRHKIEWLDEAKAIVQRQIDEYDFLASYSFDS